jgi:3-hydroxyisobutyrate dehydrogenase-like beta-hydroxyacid dehydrogenase
LQHLLKDCRLFASEAEAAGIATPMQRAAEQLIAETCTRVQQQDSGIGSGSELKLSDADYSSVYEAVVHPKQGGSGQ